MTDAFFRPSVGRFTLANGLKRPFTRGLSKTMTSMAPLYLMYKESQQEYQQEYQEEYQYASKLDTLEIRNLVWHSYLVLVERTEP